MDTGAGRTHGTRYSRLSILFIEILLLNAGLQLSVLNRFNQLLEKLTNA
ncbi:MAG: hypothetical protein FGF53_00625 [Candidatus Brockarchaeota archaeon]|nr:hypothetical protein [Candidatus Brockarchaeota archaeon]MBO3809080.1 hypothetical protein [Candidatus Brockarchaeota archaeon]MBO3841059.1 hypothetical protein [Candidatus Brockarchaeota archaeon]